MNLSSNFIGNDNDEHNSQLSRLKSGMQNESNNVSSSALTNNERKDI